MATRTYNHTSLPLTISVYFTPQSSVSVIFPSSLSKMEGVCRSLGDNSEFSPSLAFGESLTSLPVIEIFHDGVTSLRRSLLPCADIESKGIIGHGSTPPGRRLLQLVGVRLRKEWLPWRLDVRKEAFDSLLTYLEVGNLYKYSFTGFGGCITLTSSTSCREQHDFRSCAIFFLDLFGVYWNRDTSTGQTKALFWGGEWTANTMQRTLLHQKNLAGHPMFLAFCIAIMLSHLMERDLNRVAVNIQEVENRTQHHSFRNRSAGTAEGDYASLSARMSGASTLLAGED